MAVEYQGTNAILKHLDPEVFDFLKERLGSEEEVRKNLANLQDKSIIPLELKVTRSRRGLLYELSFKDGRRMMITIQPIVPSLSRVRIFDVDDEMRETYGTSTEKALASMLAGKELGNPGFLEEIVDLIRDPLILSKEAFKRALENARTYKQYSHERYQKVIHEIAKDLAFRLLIM